MEIGQEVFVYFGNAKNGLNHYYLPQNISMMIKVVSERVLTISVCWKNPKDQDNQKYARKILRERYEKGDFFLITMPMIYLHLIDYGPKGVYNYCVTDPKRYYEAASFTHYTPKIFKDLIEYDFMFMKFLEEKCLLVSSNKYNTSYAPYDKSNLGDFVEKERLDYFNEYHKDETAFLNKLFNKPEERKND